MAIVSLPDAGRFRVQSLLAFALVAESWTWLGCKRWFLLFLAWSGTERMCILMVGNGTAAISSLPLLDNKVLGRKRRDQSLKVF
jgi:hypothetical protein